MSDYASYKPYCRCPKPSEPVISNAGDNDTQFTQKFMQSVIINNAKFKKGGKISYFKTGLNVYGRATGSPFGYGQPPRNNF